MGSANPFNPPRDKRRGKEGINLAARVSWRWRVAAGACLAALWGGAGWLDHALPMAGVWALLGLGVSTGFVHGALDVQLLLQRFASPARVLAATGVYLLAVLAVGVALSAHAGTALLVLVAMSAWHFGESYGRWAPSRPLADFITRVVVGGAPVLLFPWMVPDATAVQLLPWLSVDTLQTWRGLGLMWLILFAGWVGSCGVPKWRAYRYAWIELAGIGALHLSLSPLMAFALYFGAYHAPVHIWRVWRSARGGENPQTGTGRWWAFTAVMALTILLGAMLWNQPINSLAQPVQVGEIVRWLVVSLAALTSPHLVLISACASVLSASRTQP